MWAFSYLPIASDLHEHGDQLQKRRYPLEPVHQTFTAGARSALSYEMLESMFIFAHDGTAYILSGVSALPLPLFCLAGEASGTREASV